MVDEKQQAKEAVDRYSFLLIHEDARVDIDPGDGTWRVIEIDGVTLKEACDAVLAAVKKWGGVYHVDYEAKVPRRGVMVDWLHELPEHPLTKYA